MHITSCRVKDWRRQWLLWSRCSTIGAQTVDIIDHLLDFCVLDRRKLECGRDIFLENECKRWYTPAVNCGEHKNVVSVLRYWTLDGPWSERNIPCTASSVWGDTTFLARTLDDSWSQSKQISLRSMMHRWVQARLGQSLFGSSHATRQVINHIVHSGCETVRVPGSVVDYKNAVSIAYAYITDASPKMSSKCPRTPRTVHLYLP